MRISESPNNSVQSKILTWVKKFQKYISFVYNLKGILQILWLEQKSDPAVCNHRIHLPTGKRLRSQGELKRD